MPPQSLHLRICNSGMRPSDRKPDTRLFVHGATPRPHSTLRLKIYSANESGRSPRPALIIIQSRPAGKAAPLMGTPALRKTGFSKG